MSDRGLAVASAAAHDLNEDLTIIVSSAVLALEFLKDDHPARPLLIELQQAARRCAWKTSGLLNYSARQGTRPVNVPMEKLILEAA